MKSNHNMNENRGHPCNLQTTKSLYRDRQIPSFCENALKKTTEYFLKFLVLFESKMLSVNNGK